MHQPNGAVHATWVEKLVHADSADLLARKADEFFKIDSVNALEAKLREAGVGFEFDRYLEHYGFANETAVRPGRIPGTHYDSYWA